MKHDRGDSSNAGKRKRTQVQVQGPAIEGERPAERVAEPPPQCAKREGGALLVGEKGDEPITLAHPKSTKTAKAQRPLALTRVFDEMDRDAREKTIFGGSLTYDRR